MSYIACYAFPLWYVKRKACSNTLALLIEAFDVNGTLICRFRKPSKKVPGKFGLRFYKNVGLGFRTPKEAIEGGFQHSTAALNSVLLFFTTYLGTILILSMHEQLSAVPCMVT